MTTTTEHQPDTAVDQQDLKKKIKKAVKDLPPMPTVVIKIQKLLFDPNSTAQQVADFIERDQAIAAKVLKMANSTYYGMSGKVSSVHHAAVILGFKALGELCTIAAFSDFMGNKLPGYGYLSDELWKHSLAVAGAAKLIAEKINPQIIHEALTAGLIHDIGKIGVRESILNKQDRLTDEEFQHIKYHCEEGEHILTPVVEDGEILKIVRNHHERYDGNGYPDHLKGEQIPLGARILGVSDAYDAMTSERPYRKPMSPEEATLEIAHCMGSQFDPEVAAAFLKTRQPNKCSRLVKI